MIDECPLCKSPMSPIGAVSPNLETFKLEYTRFCNNRDCDYTVCSSVKENISVKEDHEHD